MRLTFPVFGLVIALVGAAVPAMASNAWGDYHWERDANPLSLKLEDNVDSSWDGVLNDVEADWEDSSVLSLTVSGADGSSRCADPLTNSGPASSGLVEVCNRAYGENGWLGVARIWVAADGTHITAAIAAVNDSYLGTGGDYNDPNARRHVLCQEVGHAFGLDHQRGPRNQTCMNDMWGIFSSAFISPNTHDYDQLETIYAHLDGGSGGGGSEGGGGGGGPPCDKNPSHPRCQGPAEVTRLPNGQTIVTWIFYVPRLSR